MIAIEGVLGVGKSTLQRRIHDFFCVDMLEQEYSTHPYLEIFYDNPQKYFLEKDMIFLIMSYHQLKNNQTDGIAVSDFTFLKAKVFAEVFWGKEELNNLFNPTYNYLKRYLDPPNIVVYLTGSEKDILRRVEQRGRKMEKRISLEYLSRLDTLYRKHLVNLDCPVLYVDAFAKDFMNSLDDLSQLVHDIEAANSELTLQRR